MKILKKVLFTMVMLVSGFIMLQAQTTKKDKKAAREADLKAMLENKTYTFSAQSANPQGGGTRQLTYGYDLLINKDSLVAYLPFFGRAYIAPPINTFNNGIEFTSTKFTYSYAIVKNGYEITIIPTDAKDIQKMYLMVSPDGYATLSVNNYSRSPISYYGSIEPNPVKKENKD